MIGSAGCGRHRAAGKLARRSYTAAAPATTSPLRTPAIPWQAPLVANSSAMDHGDRSRREESRRFNFRSRVRSAALHGRCRPIRSQREVATEKGHRSGRIRDPSDLVSTDVSRQTPPQASRRTPPPICRRQSSKRDAQMIGLTFGSPQAACAPPAQALEAAFAARAVRGSSDAIRSVAQCHGNKGEEPGTGWLTDRTRR